MTVATNIVQYLDEQGVGYEVLSHRETFSTSEEAKSLGITASHVAKTLVIKAGGGEVLAVIPASERVDTHKLRDVIGDNHARLATEDEMSEQYPEFELGAVPPLGELFGAPVYLDLWVKVLKNWRKSPIALTRLGFPPSDKETA